ncbi:hypothetical protein GUJ93_ZPchr0010g7411 [Zizania palustris]|uniref:Uncharacterized protein n=1 Tax=Zizania palustris TaxID=103762 RepID=A0A8J5WBS3_ZIZPA|nr:hypothetical protein GUJ93_ZPchr0010g7411 [Zizania palustris]
MAAGAGDDQGSPSVNCPSLMEVVAGRPATVPRARTPVSTEPRAELASAAPDLYATKLAARDEGAPAANKRHDSPAREGRTTAAREGRAVAVPSREAERAAAAAREGRAAAVTSREAEGPVARPKGEESSAAGALDLAAGPPDPVAAMVGALDLSMEAPDPAMAGACPVEAARPKGEGSPAAGSPNLAAGRRIRPWQGPTGH